MERPRQIERAEPLDFGSLLKERRVEAGLTQEALAERSGLSVRGISALERGDRHPYRDTAERLAEALGLRGAALKRFLLAARPRPHQPSAGQETVAPASAATPLAIPSGRSPDAVTNLPSQLTSFVGREREMAEVRQLLGTTRLLTLTGAGGCGKTRLAYQVAEQLLRERRDEYPDGVWAVELASLSHPELVPQTVALALGLHPPPGLPVPSILQGHLRPRRLLLVLDNCEHLLDSVAELAESLLRACPSLKILATSREALQVPGETRWLVPPLSMPDADGHLLAEVLLRSEAVRLFVERSRAARPDFALTERNAGAVASICTRLDGMPLAIELAAARLHALSAEQLASRLDDRFRLLAAGSRTALPRHQTLRATIDWSYDLLDEPERCLFRRLAVFAGGWTLEAAEAVCAGEAPEVPIERADVLDLLAHLVSRSLVVAEEGVGGETRYRFLETIREYARERLAESGEEEAVRRRHRDWFLAFAESFSPNTYGFAVRSRAGRVAEEGEPLRALVEVRQESDNLRAALDFSRGRDDPEVELRLGAAIAYLSVQYPTEEPRARLADLLARTAGIRTARRIQALRAAAVLENVVGGDNLRALAYQEEALSIAREIGDLHLIAFAQHYLGMLTFGFGDVAEARRLIEEALSISREISDPQMVPLCLICLGGMLHRVGADAEARRHYEACRDLARREGADLRALEAETWLAAVMLAEGDVDGAERVLERKLQAARPIGSSRFVADCLSLLGDVARARGDLDRARSRYVEGLRIHHGVGDLKDVAVGLLRVAGALQAGGESESAAHLLGAVDAWYHLTSRRLDCLEHPERERDLEATRAALGEAEFDRCFAEGQAMTLEDACQYALQGDG